MPGLPAQAMARAVEGPAAGLAVMGVEHIGSEGLVLEGLDDISPEAAVRFGWCRHHKAMVSLEIS